jgi:hypothetical protein
MYQTEESQSIKIRIFARAGVGVQMSKNFVVFLFKINLSYKKRCGQQLERIRQAIRMELKFENFL